MTISTLQFPLLGYSFKANRATKLLHPIMLAWLNLRRENSFSLQIWSLLEYVPSANFFMYNCIKGKDIFTMWKSYGKAILPYYISVNAVHLHHQLKLFSQTHIHMFKCTYTNTQIRKHSECSSGVLKLFEALPFMYCGRFLSIFHNCADNLKVMLFSRCSR